VAEVYSYSPKKLVLIAVVAVLIGLAAVQGVSFTAMAPRHETATGQHETATSQGGQEQVVWGGNESNPASPVRIRLGISSPPPLGKTAELLAVIMSAMDASGVKVQIRLPEGFEMISGSPDWKGDLARDHTVELRYVIKSVQVGNWIIEGSVRWDFAAGSFYTDSDRIYISVSESSAYVSTTTFSETTSHPPGNETQPPASTQPGSSGESLPTQESGGLVMFVSPTLLAVGVETTVTVSYGMVSATREEPKIVPGLMTGGGPPSFEGPVVVAYGPVLAENGNEWLAKIKPTSAGVIKVVGQDALGKSRVYAEIVVVDNLPPPPPPVDVNPQACDASRPRSCDVPT